jgi:hypothetical protein
MIVRRLSVMNDDDGSWEASRDFVLFSQAAWLFIAHQYRKQHNCW